MRTRPICCISFFTLVLETVLTRRAVQSECGKPLLLVDCYVPYQRRRALVSNRFKYICTFLFGRQHQNGVCIVTDISFTLNVHVLWKKVVPKD